MNQPLQHSGAMAPPQTDRQALCQHSSLLAHRDQLPTGKELDSFNTSLAVIYRAPAPPRKAQECTTYRERNTDNLQLPVSYEHTCRKGCDLVLLQISSCTMQQIASGAPALCRNPSLTNSPVAHENPAHHQIPPSSSAS